MFKKFEIELNSIVEFKKIYLEFLSFESRKDYTADEKIRHSVVRENINQMSIEVYKYVVRTGVQPTLYYSPPPAIGGMAGNIDLFANIFNLWRFEISPQMLIDTLDKAQGYYLFKQKEYKKDIKNPFYWIGIIINLPFKLITFSGFNGTKIKESIIGKIFRLVVSFLVFISILTSILNYCNIKFSDMKQFINGSE
jgi:hypothetical protein